MGWMWCFLARRCGALIIVFGKKMGIEGVDIV